MRWPWQAGLLVSYCPCRVITRSPFPALSEAGRGLGGAAGGALPQLVCLLSALLGVSAGRGMEG